MTTINGRELMFVEVPESMPGLPEIFDGKLLVDYWTDGNELGYEFQRKDLPEGEWEIIGKASELTEDQWKEIVERHKFSFMDERRNRQISFKDYRDAEEFEVDCFDTATKSGLSLISSLGKQPETTLIIVKK